MPWGEFFTIVTQILIVIIIVAIAIGAFIDIRALYKDKKKD